MIWSRLDHVPVMGRLLVLQRHKGVSSNYDCYICDCPADFVDLMIDPASMALLVNDWLMSDAFAKRQEHCNGYNWWDDAGADYSSDNPIIATATSGGLVTGRSGGSTTIRATYTDYYYTYDSQLQDCVSHPRTRPASGGANVVSITGPQTVWWFNGVLSTGYTTSIQLTAYPAGQSQYTWAFSAGSDKAMFVGQSANTIYVVGKALSVAPGADVKVKVTVKFSDNSTKTSSDYAITVRGPKKLLASSKFHSANQDFGYDSLISYHIRDNFDAAMPSTIAFTEGWTTNVDNSPYPTNNWGWPTAHGDSTSTSELFDHITGPGLGNVPPPNPTPTFDPLGTTEVQHRGQEWRVGHVNPGNGARVQTDTMQRFTGHGDHTAITSPAP